MAFNWFKKKDQQDLDSKTRVRVSRPIKKDITEDYVINKELTKGLYHNQYPGMKLSGGLAYPMISIPIAFMGFPLVKTENENDETDERLKKLNEQILDELTSIHTESHRDGTIWVYPKYDSKSMSMVLEFIPDDSVTDIIKDINTGKVIAIYTDEIITIKTGYNETAEVRKIRVFTETTVQVQYKAISGTLPTSIRDKNMRNPAGILPIPFANNNDGSEIRGYSDYERVISNLKSYHDISLSELNILSKFSVKMIQETSDVNKWLNDNGYGELSEIDIATIDIIFNLTDKEKTSFAFPERATDAYQKALKRIFKVLVEASGVPELVWGVKTEGSQNTAEEQMTTLVQFVKEKQRKKIKPYQQLFSAILRILSVAESVNYDTGPLIVSWNDLEAISDQVKSQIFKNFADGLAKVMSVASLTKQQLYNLWKINFPKATEEDFEEFVVALDGMAKFKQFSSSSLMEGLETQGFDESGNPTSE